jgi:FAD/FMN-containing dehydrogenase
VDFASAGSSQIGGNIATNAGGIKVIRYGLTRDWIAGLTVVTGKGDVLRLNRGLVKNATGYDLRHLFIGSEGTLGFVVEADVRLTRAPEPQLRHGARGAAFSRPSRRARALPEGAHPVGVRILLGAGAAEGHRSPRASRPLSAPAEFYALVEFDESALDAATAAFEHCVGEGWVSDGVLSQSETQAANLWQLREGISESIAPYTPYKNDVAVRISRMPEFLDRVDALVRKRYPDFEVCWYGHIGDGNLHLNVLKPAASTATPSSSAAISSARRSSRRWPTGAAAFPPSTA